MISSWWNASDRGFSRSYSWRASQWSECRVDVLLSQQDRRRGNHTSLCGGGIQTREVFCVQMSSEPGLLRTREGKQTFHKRHAWHINSAETRRTTLQ